jgi:hypothetical protein
MSIPNPNSIPPLPYAPQVKKDSTLAIISLIAGIAGWTIIPVIGAIVAVVTGHLAKKEIRESGGALSGDGMALAGIILGYTMIGITLLVIVLIILAVFAFIPTATTAFGSLNGCLPYFHY